MVYYRIIFNSVREYTPDFIKTVPYSQCVKPALGRKAPVVWKAFKDPQTIRMMRFFKRTVFENRVVYHIFFFFVVMAFTKLMWMPMLWIYQTNNRHRQLDVVLKKEAEYKARMEAEEEDDEDEDEEESEE